MRTRNVSKRPRWNDIERDTEGSVVQQGRDAAASSASGVAQGGLKLFFLTGIY